MWLRFSLPLILCVLNSTASAAALDLPGDTLVKGQQFIGSETSISDWHYAATFVSDTDTVSEGEKCRTEEETDVGDIAPCTLDDSARGIADGNNNGYDFGTSITYLYGVTSDIAVGVRYGYQYEKDDSDIDSGAPAAADLQGDIQNEGGTDVALMGMYRIVDGVALTVDLVLPICSSDSASSLCNSDRAQPDNDSSSGASGGQGNGYYQLSGELAANWLTELDTRWYGRVFSSITLSDDVMGKKASSPFIYGFGFGNAYSAFGNHNFLTEITLVRAMEYSAYSDQVQADVRYSRGSSLAMKTDYLWNWLPNVQIRPFLDIALVQQPSMRFESEFEETTDSRGLEYSTGTHITLGAQLRANF